MSETEAVDLELVTVRAAQAATDSRLDYLLDAIARRHHSMLNGLRAALELERDIMQRRCANLQRIAQHADNIAAIRAHTIDALQAVIHMRD
jgi:hypothetical protein